MHLRTLLLASLYTVVPTTAQQVMVTVAGDGNPAFAGDGGPAASASLNNPLSAAFDSAGNLFIADQLSHRIRRVDAGTGVISTIAGTGTAGYGGDGGPATGAMIDTPFAVAVDSSDNILIADVRNHRVRRVDVATGVITTIAGNGLAGYSGDGGLATAARIGSPTAIAIDAAGNFWVASDSVIRRIDGASGVVSTAAGDGTFGNSGDGGPATSARISGPRGLALDGAGNLFIADIFNNRIRRVDAITNVITTVAGTGAAGFSGDGGPATAAVLHNAAHVAVDASGNLFITDKNNHRIRRIDAATGIIETIAGDGPGAFGGDGGDPLVASFRHPEELFFDANGDLFVCDAANHRVRALTAAVSPRDIALADLDGDGSLDIVTADENSDEIGVRLNDGSGNLAARAGLGLGGGTGPIAVAIGDLDGDAAADDIAAICAGSNDIVVITDPSGTPTTLSIASGGFQPSHLAVGDLDDSGTADIVFGRLGEPFAGGAGLALILDNGAATELLAAPAPVAKVGLCDLDQDGDLDIIALVHSTPDRIELLENDGAGVFTASASIVLPTTTLANGLCHGDFDEDGDVDFAVILPQLFPIPAQNLRIFTNAGSGAMGSGDFTAQPDIPSAGTFGVSVACGDLEDDTVDGFFGRVDVAVVNAGSGDLTVHHGFDVASMTFGSFESPAVGTNPIAVAVGDLNGDGGADIAVANQGSYDVSILLTTQPALAQPYGAGCAGSEGVPSLAGSGVPTIGGLFTAQLTSGRPFAPALCLFGTATGALDLGGSCSLLLDLSLSQVRFLDGTGSDNFSFGVPLAVPPGIDLMMQYLVFDPAGSFSGVASMSNGLRLQAGS